MFKQFCLNIIKFYQKTISPDHGAIFENRYPNGYCKFRPTCSQYTYEAIEKYGVIKGLMLGFRRILRCNPCSKGGYNPLR